jgi:SAM-dependent methyltransferase
VTETAAPTDLLHTHPELYAEYLPASGSEVVRFVQDAIDRFGGLSAKRILDVGCGLGREVAALAASGHRCEGLDASPEMISAARKAYPHLTFHLGDQRALPAHFQYDAVLSLGSALLHNKTLPDLRRTLRGFVRGLRPGGLLLVELRNGGHWLGASGQRDLTEEHHERVELSTGGQLDARLRYRLDLRRQLLLRSYDWWLPCGQHIEETLEQLLLLPGQLLDELATAGMTVLAAFSEPAAAEGQWSGAWPADDDLSGSRLHVVARR